MNKWFLPAFSVALGIGLWAASWAGGHPGQGAFMFATMAAFGAVFLPGGRSETLGGMRGDGRDERWAMIDLRATAFAGLVVITAIIAGFLIEIAHGRSGSPYAQLGAIAEIAYLAGFFIGRWRWRAARGPTTRVPRRANRSGAVRQDLPAHHARQVRRV